jgi:alpha-D-xyloside xylohydrolase
VPEEISFQNEPVDPSAEFAKQANHFFAADKVASFDPGRAAGELHWKRLAMLQRVSYHQVTLQLEDFQLWRDYPEEEYQDEQSFPFELEFLGPRAVRVRIAARPGLGDRDSPMLERCEPGPVWDHEDDGERCVYRSEHAELELRRDPWRLELRDAGGRVLTRTNHHTESPSVINTNPIPFSCARSSASFHRHVAASLMLSPGERLYGGGESFTRLDKRGQRLLLWTRDAYSSQTPFMYKPVPFYLSNRGYAVFVHTSMPATFDLGHAYDSAAVLYLTQPDLDMFLFVGEPKDVVSEYTALTGRSRMPPRWSFGLTIGRDSYESAGQVRTVARRIRDERVPCDMLHLDTEWMEHKYRLDFRFSPTRFPEPERLLAELRELGFRVSLWIFPYLHPRNELHMRRSAASSWCWPATARRRSTTRCSTSATTRPSAGSRST